MLNAITPNWPAPTWVRAITTTRWMEGASENKYQNFNLALHVADEPRHVLRNRLQLQQDLNIIHTPAWLKQTHSNTVVMINYDNMPKLSSELGIAADGAYTQEVGLPCAVLSGDCLPLLLCDAHGTIVAALHCGWRGILEGIIHNAVKLLKSHTQGQLFAWLGPAIGPAAFEVGPEVVDQFILQDNQTGLAFVPAATPRKWLADIYTLAKLKLQHEGINEIYGGTYCTYTDPKFYSYRRDPQTGRMATLIWLDKR